MSAFLDFYSEPDAAADRREIQSLLRCDETSAVTIQLLGDLIQSMDELSWGMLGTEVEDE